MNYKLESLFNEVKKMCERQKVLCEQARIRGENFNIFKVLNLSYDEVRLHSAFICELLNISGSHGLKDKFFKEFLKIVIAPIISISQTVTDIKFDGSLEIFKEKYIGEKTKDSGGRIDILIEDKINNSAIIIENKIYAREQENQLLRYNNFGSKHYKKFLLLYLTLEGNDASDISIGNENNVEYYPISYRYEILPWLERCIEVASLYPHVREVIYQYYCNLKYILGISNMESSDSDFIEVLTNPNNLEATFKILSLKKDIQKKIISCFINKLVTKFSELMKAPDYKDWYMKISDDALKNFSELTYGDYISFYSDKYPSFSFVIGGESQHVFYSIKLSNPDIDNPNGTPLNKRYVRKGNKVWPFGWAWTLKESKWDSKPVLEDISKENIEESKIFQEIKDNLESVIRDSEIISNNIRALKEST